MAMKSVDSTTRFPHGARHSRMVTPWVLEFANSPQLTAEPSPHHSAEPGCSGNTNCPSC